jgi:hypothetical protein
MPNKSFLRGVTCKGDCVEVNSNNPYLYGDHPVITKYKATLDKCLSILEEYSTPTQIRKLKKDLQITGNRFEEAKFLQAACETAVSASIASAFPSTFEYEPKLNPPADVDCAFSCNGYRFNVEVKCPDYSKVHAQHERDVFSIGAFGRMHDYNGVVADLMGLFESGDKLLEVQPHMDNKLKDYLLSANKKFTENIDKKELNVLLVCCNDSLDMQKWFYYMFGVQGLFTPSSFHKPQDYSKVDAVVLTNLYHRHYSYQSKTKIEDHWSLGNSFNLIFKNRSMQNKKDEAILALVDILPNFSNEIFNFKVPKIEEPLLIPVFVNKELTLKERYYFEPKM